MQSSAWMLRRETAPQHKNNAEKERHDPLGAVLGSAQTSVDACGAMHWFNVGNTRSPVLVLSPNVQYYRLKLKRLAYNLERNSLTVVKGKQGLWIYQTFEVHCIITIFARMPFILNILIYVSEILGAFYIWPKRQHMHLVSSVASQFILKLPALLIIAQFWSVQIWIFIMQFWQGMPQFVIGMGCFLFSFYVYWHI